MRRSTSGSSTPQHAGPPPDFSGGNLHRRHQVDLPGHDLHFEGGSRSRSASCSVASTPTGGSPMGTMPIRNRARASHLSGPGTLGGGGAAQQSPRGMPRVNPPAAERQTSPRGGQRASAGTAPSPFSGFVNGPMKLLGWKK